MDKIADMIPIDDQDLAHTIFSDMRVKPIVDISTRVLPNYLKINLWMFPILSKINIFTTIIWFIISPFLVLYLKMDWINIVYWMLVWVLATWSSWSNWRYWYLLIAFIGYYIFLSESSQAVQYLFFYGIIIWVITFLEYKIEMMLIQKELINNKNLFRECMDNGFIKVFIPRKDYETYYKK